MLTFHCLVSDTPFNGNESYNEESDVLQNNIVEGNAQWDLLPADVSGDALITLTRT